MQLYNRGIRRRLAPMLGNDRRRLELAYSLLFSLPGTPMIQYGDEIGMGEDLSLNEREATRTPMQWTDEPHGGFTSGEKDRAAGRSTAASSATSKVNVNAQRRDPNSFMNWIARLIRVRKECMEIAWGECEVLECDADPVLGPAYRFRKAAMVSLHNFSDAAQTVHLRLKEPGGRAPRRPHRRRAQPRGQPRHARDRARRLRLPLVPHRRGRRNPDSRDLLTAVSTPPVLHN